MDAGWVGSFLVDALFFPRFPPAPSPPRGVTGGLNSRFCFFAPNKGVVEGCCGAGLGAGIGERRSCSQWSAAWFGYRRKGVKAGACLSEASLRTTPRVASSARYPVGARPLARLSFVHLFFGEATKK